MSEVASTARDATGLDPALAGAFIGGVLALVGSILGGLGGSYLINRRDERRRAADHRAAIRAVLYEMRLNLDSADSAKQKGSTQGLVFPRDAYQAVRPALFTYLPDQLAASVTRAYGCFTLMQPAVNQVANFEAVQAHREACRTAFDGLRAYAGRLGVRME